mmetsp:Transcript_16575/g.29004  ORF Transcript_16575/g.29004 Transcript_16575/m.29004 type:complete len:727 (-) Transcript_16575:32-2212(-)
MLALRAFVLLAAVSAHQDRSSKKGLLRTEKEAYLVEGSGSLSKLGATFCAEDGELCHCTGTVYYGSRHENAGGTDNDLLRVMLKEAHKSRNVDAGVSCTSDEFGGANVNGPKHCLCLPRSSVAEESLRQDDGEGNPSSCGMEGEVCSCEGTVFFGRRYGDEALLKDSGITLDFLAMTQDMYKERDVRGEIVCSDEEFAGGNAVINGEKQCYCKRHAVTVPRTSAGKAFELGEKGTRSSMSSSKSVCAREGDKCKCIGTVYLGRRFVNDEIGGKPLDFISLVASPFLTRDVNGEIACDAKEFEMSKGELQLSAKVPKQCMCRGETPGPDRMLGVHSGESLGEVSHVANEESSGTDTDQSSTTICAEEGKMCYCSGTVFYGRRYGKDGALSDFEFLTANPHKAKDIDGNVLCEGGEFGGNPQGSQTNHCLCRKKKESFLQESQSQEDELILPFSSQVLVQGVECAKEGETCRCNGKIYFGKRFINGKDGDVTTLVHMENLVHKEMETSNSVTCSEEEFGALEGGEAKHCICKPTEKSGFSIISSDATGPPGFCAKEGDVCQCKGTAFYGRRYKNDKDGDFLEFSGMAMAYHEEMQVDSSITCSAAAFKATAQEKPMHCLCLAPGESPEHVLSPAPPPLATPSNLSPAPPPPAVLGASILEDVAGQQTAEEEIRALHAKLQEKEEAYTGIAKSYENIVQSFAALDREVEETHRQLHKLSKKGLERMKEQ